MIVSCEKEKCIDTYRINKYGGTWRYDNVEIEGSSLIISDEYEEAESEHDIYQYFWHSRLTWASTIYRYNEKQLWISIDPNETGKPRACKIQSKTLNGKNICYRVRQGR